MRETHVQMKLPEFEEYQIYFAIYLATKSKIQKFNYIHVTIPFQMIIYMSISFELYLCIRRFDGNVLKFT